MASSQLLNTKSRKHSRYGNGLTLHPDYLYYYNIFRRERNTFSSLQSMINKVGGRPAGKYLRRKDKSKPLGPNNYQWVNIMEKGGRLITANGKRMSVRDWAKYFGVSITAIYYRLNRYPVAVAMSEKLWK
jgi:hypothetical protein